MGDWGSGGLGGGGSRMGCNEFQCFPQVSFKSVLVIKVAQFRLFSLLLRRCCFG